MTDRVKGFTVVLDHDIREDDFQRIKEAVEMFKGVVKVEPSVVTSKDYMNREVIKHKLITDLFNFLKEK